jgi:hypothetical protein
LNLFSELAHQRLRTEEVGTVTKMDESYYYVILDRKCGGTGACTLKSTSQAEALREAEKTNPGDQAIAAIPILEG